MFDPKATLDWVRRVLTDPQASAVAYRETDAPWPRTFTLITLPVYLAGFVGGFILSWIFGRPMLFGAMAGAPALLLFSLLWSLAWMFVVAFIFDYFAGVFGGTRNYDGAFAALSLAMIPATIIGILSPLPWIGWLIGLAAGIYSLVLAYQFVPVFMSVPEENRVKHFVVSILVGLVINFLIAGMLGALFAPDIARDFSAGRDSGAEHGVLGGFERQANIAEQAANDRFDPPADGRLTRRQVAAFADTLAKTAALRERLTATLQRTEEGQSLTQMFGGVRDAVRLSTAEMEVVKTGGGNWAEHQWVRNQLETARIQQDINPAVKHNYELFLEYREAIERHE